MDCTPICRLPEHAELILSAATRENGPEFHSVAKRICANPANLIDRFGRHLIHIAVSCGKTDILEWLVEEGKTDLGLKDQESGWTPLHRALYYGQLGCAVKLIQYGVELYMLDKDNLSPLDLVMLDCPYKMSNAAEARVVSEYKTSLDDELTLKDGDVIENVRLSDMSINYWMGTLNGKRGFFPKDCVELVRQDYRAELYTWGSNINFTLGHRDENTRITPELVESLCNDRTVSIQQVVMCKFHSVFLTNDGRVYTCGHGRGGRLGHGDEKTQLSPRRVEGLGHNKCICITAAQDHTVVVMDNDVVLSFGLNDKQQLGHTPSPSQCLLPKMVHVKSWKGKRIVGVAAGQYHTVFYTNTEVFTCGLNIGQLGHIKGEKFQASPRQVSSLLHKDIQISSVVCGDAATVCATIKGDIYILSNYTCQKVINRFAELTHLVVSGGDIDLNSSQDVSKVNEKLTLTLLNSRGVIYHWKVAYGGTKRCHWSLNRDFVVTDVAVGKKLFIVTDRGEAFSCTRSDDHIHGSKHKDVIGYKVERIPMIHRGVRIFTDVKSRGFAVLQIDPKTGLDERPTVCDSRICDDFTQLLEETTIEDNIHDVTLMVGSREFPAHSFILTSRSEAFRDLISTDYDSHVDNDHSSVRVLKLDSVNDNTVLTKWLKDLYSGRAVDDTLLFPNHNTQNKRRNKPVKQELQPSTSEANHGGEDLENIGPILANHIALIGGDLDDFSNLTVDRAVGFVDDETVSPRRKKNRKNKAKLPKSLNKRSAATSHNGKEADTCIQPKKRMKFSRKSCPQYHDVTIESEDGVQFSCHKCVLVARLDYFRSMLACDWLEASSKMTSLKMPLHSSVLVVVLDYIYTDEVSRIQGCTDVEFIGNVLVVADQLLIARLTEICESLMAKLILSKNVMELLEFSSVYNADQLKSACLEFICCNLNSLLEAGYFSILRNEALEEVSKAYRRAIPNMAWRWLTPQDDYLIELAKVSPLSPSKKRRSSNRKKSFKSESEVEDEPAIQPDEETLDRKLGDLKLEDRKLEDRKLEDRELDDLILEDVFDEEETRSNEVSSSSPLQTENGDDTASGDIPELISAKPSEGLWYRKHGNEAVEIQTKKTKSPHKNKDKVTTTTKQSTVMETVEYKGKETPTKQQTDKSQDSTRKPWGTVASASNSPASGLRAIMEQEQGTGTTNPPASQPSPGRTWPGAPSKTNPPASQPPPGRTWAGAPTKTNPPASLPSPGRTWSTSPTKTNTPASKTSPGKTEQATVPTISSETESPLQSNMAIKWETGAKQSQKQRKKSRKSSSSAEDVSPVNDINIYSEAKSPEPKHNPWGLADKKPTPVRTLRDLIEQERQSQSKQLITTTAKTKPQPSPAKEKPNATRSKLSWGLLSRVNKHGAEPAEEIEKSKEIPAKSAWGSPPLVDTSPPSTSMFADILHSQERENTNLDRARKKPLSQIQLEDRAIQELLDHYGGQYNACEYITVERIPVAIATPVWNRDRSSSVASKS